MKHLAYDMGACDAALADAIGCHVTCVQSKTSKTQCGVRVKQAEIDNAKPTCDRCIAAWVAADDEAKELLRILSHTGVDTSRSAAH